MSTFVATAVTAETRKLRATRSNGLIVLVTLALTVAIATATVLLAGKQGNDPLTADTLDTAIRAPGQVLGFAMLVIGVLAAAGEYRHNTIVTTLLAQPRRLRVVGAKVAAVAAYGTVAAIITSAVFAAVNVPLLGAHDAPAQQLAQVPFGVLAVVLAAVGWGVIGVALGLLLRNQVAGIVVALLWQFVVEGLLPVVLQAPNLGTYLPGGASGSLLRLGGDAPSGMLDPWQGGLLFLAYAVGLVLVAAVVAVPRDTT